MQPSPPIYKRAINADSRKINLLITLWRKNEDGQDVWWRLNKNGIESTECIQELQDAGIPCSYIGKNIFTAKIYNEDNILFSEEYNVHKYIKRGTKVHAEVQIATEDGNLWGQTLFTGYADSWDMSEDATFCTLTAYDKLHFLGMQPSPWFRPTGFFDSQGMTLAEFIKYWFDLIGLSEDEYQIDPGLTYQPRFIFTSGATNADVFKTIAQTGLCAIYCDAFGIIKIELVPKSRRVCRDFDDYTQVVSSSFSQLGYSDYTHVDVISHTVPSFDNRDFSITAQNYTALSTTAFASGNTEFNDISISSGRMPTAVRVVSKERISQTEYNKIGPYITVQDYDYTNGAVSLTLNTDKAHSADVAVYFVTMDVSKTASHEVASPDYEEDIFNIKKVLTIDSELINSEAYAQQVADTYSKILVDAKNAVTASLRGDPAIELLDLVSITNPRAGMTETAVLPTRLRYSYDGSLSCDMDAIMYSAVSMLLYAFIAPGQYVPFDAMAVYVSATVNPTGMAIVSGTGPYAVGDVCTLTCIPIDGYEFMYWTDKNGTILSRYDEYTFEVGEQAEFICYVEVAKAYTSFSIDVPDDGQVSLPVMSLTAATGTIDWGDGTVEAYNAEEPVKHTYSMPATYTITLRTAIANMPAEIFANSTIINRFKSGSDMKYLPAGVFYNSTVANVDFTATPNLYAQNQSVYMYNEVQSNFNAYMYDDFVTLYTNNGSNIVNIPMYYNSKLVKSVNVTNTSQNSILDFTDAPMLYTVLLNSRNIINVSGINETVIFGTYNINTSNIVVPNGAMSVSILSASIENVVIPSSTTSLGINAVTATDIKNVYINDGSNRIYIGINNPNNIPINISIPSSLNNITIVGSDSYTLIRR